MESQTNRKRYVIDACKSTHVAWWAEVLGVSEDALLEAVQRVGNDAHAVEDYLSMRKANEFGTVHAWPSRRSASDRSGAV